MNENYTINDKIDKIIPYINNERKVYSNKIKEKKIQNLNNLNLKVFDNSPENEKNRLYFQNCVIIPWRNNRFIRIRK